MKSLLQLFQWREGTKYYYTSQPHKIYTVREVICEYKEYVHCWIAVDSLRGGRDYKFNVPKENVIVL